MDTLPLEASLEVMKAQYEGEQAAASVLYPAYLNLISRLSIIEQSVDLGMLETPIMEVRG